MRRADRDEGASGTDGRPLKIQPMTLRLGWIVGLSYVCYSVVFIGALWAMVWVDGFEVVERMRERVDQDWSIWSWIALLLAPLATVSVIAFYRRRERCHWWVLNEKGVQVFDAGDLTTVIAWADVRSVARSRKGSVRLWVRDEWFPMRLPGIEREVAKRFVTEVERRIEARELGAVDGESVEG